MKREAGLAACAAATEIVTIDTPVLGDRSYLATDGRVALVVDPQRDINRALALAAARGAAITHVFETHIHNDYVTGGLALARQTGAAYHVNAADEVAFDRVPVRDGDVLAVGDAMRVRVIATPGHTFTHLSYALADAPGRLAAVFTGGSLLYGSTGRPDLLGPAHKAVLASAQHASARRLAAELPDGTPVWPTHGFGSFCSATPSEGAASTIGQEKRVNPVLALDEETYVAELLAGLDSYPAYYAELAGAADTPRERTGGRPPASIPIASFADLAAVRSHRPVTVLDVRRPLEWAGSHIEGALHIPLHHLRSRISEIPPGEIWVHCRSGYRAVVGASLLAAAGRAVVAVDDEYASAADAGLRLVTAQAAGRAA